MLKSLMNNNTFLHIKALLFTIPESVTQNLDIKKPENAEVLLHVISGFFSFITYNNGSRLYVPNKKSYK